MDDDRDDESHENIKKGSVWKHFEIANDRDRTATCNICFKLLSYRTSITNLKKHLARKHGDDEDMLSKISDDEGETIEELETYLEDAAEEDVPIDKRKILRNGAWEYFEIIDEEQRLAVCILCKEQFSYRTTSSNLAKHLKRRHYADIENTEFLNVINNEDDDNDLSVNISSGHRTSAAWDYFTIKDPVRRIATCKLCECVCSYLSSVSNLMKHVRRKHGVASERDEEFVVGDNSDTEGIKSETDTKKGSEIYKKPYERSKSSAVWEHFTIKDDVKKLATCKVCDNTFSYLTTTTNLKKHWSNKHCVQKERVTRVVDDDETDCENWGTDTENVIPNDRRRRNSSVAWRHFTIQDSDKCIAKCNLCAKSLSYLTTTTNLVRHFRNKHGGQKKKDTHDDDETECENSGTETQNVTHPKDRSKIGAVWEHFTITDPVKKIAKCNVCHNSFSYYSTTANLMNHFRRFHGVQKGKEDDSSSSENETENVTHLNDRKKTRRRKNLVWEHFTIENPVKKIAKCNVCHNSFSYLTTTANLMNHTIVAHGVQKGKEDDSSSENETENVTDQKDRSKIGAVWEHFTIIDPVKKIAKCNVCHQSFSYLSTTANLMNHFRRFHGVQKEKDDDSSSSENETENVTHSNDRRKKGVVWEHFTIKDSVKKIAKCKVCHKSFSYFSTTANLMNHLRRIHGVQKGKEDDSSSENETENVTHLNDRKKTRRRKNLVWEHFTIENPVKKIAKCNVCHNSFSYFTTTANLMNHTIVAHGVHKGKEDDSSSENETENVTHSKDRRKKGFVWEHFTIENPENKIAKCNVCHNSFSYLTTTANLMNHLRRIHGVQKEKEDDSSSSENETENVTHPKDRSKIGAVWEHFTIKDSVKKIAKCKVCHKSFSYFSTTANLMNHFRRFHGVQKGKEDDSSSSDNETENVTHPKDRRKKGVVWEHFTIENPVKKIAKCNVCHNSFSYLTTTANLMNHLRRIHGVQKGKEDDSSSENETENVTDQKDKSKLGAVWEHFTIIDPVKKIAKCNVCHQSFSYLSTTANLMNHFRRFHGVQKEKDDDSSSSENETENVTHSNDRRKKGVVWEHFTIKDSVKKIAKCKVCHKSFSYFSTTANLMNHLRRIHGVQKGKEDDSSSSENETENVTHSKDRSKIGAVWEHFTIENPVKKIAKCNVCHNSFSYFSTTANLMNHLRRFHGVQKEKEDDSSSENETENVTHSKDRRKKGAVWEHFTIENPVKKIAKCNVCHNSFSYFTTTANLMNHTIRAHGVQKEKQDGRNDDMESENSGTATENLKDGRRRKTSIAWKHFTVQDSVRCIAKCKLCDKSVSYFSSVSNLMKHFDNKHRGKKRKASSEVEGKNSETETRKRIHTGKRNSIAWNYFTIKDHASKIATCALCGKSMSYSNVSNLVKHVQNVHRKHNISDCRKNDNDDSENDVENESNKRSPIWLYFKCIDKVAKISVCLICKRQLSHLTSITNLKKHLYRKHPGVKLKDMHDGKKMLIASDGQLYEIEDETKVETLEIDDDNNDDDHQSEEPIELNAIYLDDYEGTVIEPNRKRKPSTSKRKRLIAENNDSSEGELTYQKQYSKKTSDSLDQFGKYLVSLLRQLPKELSNQLQADFVKQVMTSQLTYQSQNVVVAPSNGYSITITEAVPKGNNDAYISTEGNDVSQKVSTEDVKQTDIWGYFESDSASTAICCVCCASVPSKKGELRRHLVAEHPKLVGEILTQDEDNNDDVYSEVIYVEENPMTKEQKVKVKKIDFDSYKRAKKRRVSQEKPKKSIDEEEVESFGSYITCLMKQLPRDVCTNVQRDIINLIMNAKTRSQNKIDVQQNLIKEIMKDIQCDKNDSSFESSEQEEKTAEANDDLLEDKDDAQKSDDNDSHDDN